MSLVGAFTAQRGTARLRDLHRACGRRAVRRAIATGEVVRLSHTMVGLPDVLGARREAARLGGVVAGLSAAQELGWSVLRAPRTGTVLLPHGRKLRGRRTTAEIWWTTLPIEAVDGRTSAEATVLDCARRLPLDEALAVADSALRCGAVTQTELMTRASQSRGHGARQIRLVAERASSLAANPFESAVRSATFSSGGTFIPQREIVLADGRRIVCDLVDVEHRIVIECDSYTFHTSRSQIHRDCHRYTSLVVEGWLVLRVSWEQAMGNLDWVAEMVVAAVERQRRVRPGLHQADHARRPRRSPAVA